MDQTLIQTFIQLGAFGVLAYLVIRWQRDDITQARKELGDLVKAANAAQDNVADKLLQVAQVLGQLCGQVNDPDRDKKP